MDWTLYWFMFPVAIMVATSAMISGIGGAALFMPIYVLIFPLLGPEYPFETTVLAVIVSLITMSFSFASGVSVYAAKRQIDYKVAAGFLIISVPMALFASLMVPSLDDKIILSLYCVLITAVAISIFKSKPAITNPQSSFKSPVMTGIGGFMTGAASVGIGEVVMPQLLSRGLKGGVAAGTSVFVVLITVLASSLALGIQLFRQAQLELPWNVVCYTVPGVLIGAQIGPRLQGLIPQRKFELTIATLFIGIAIATMFVVLKDV